MATSAMTQPLITVTNLQHHRWILMSINGEPLPATGHGEKRPELDFGEQMFVSGNLGCNRFSGKGVLRDGRLLVESMIATGMACEPPWASVELTIQTVLGQESDIRLDADRKLFLQTADTILEFELKDWVR